MESFLEKGINFNAPSVLTIDAENVTTFQSETCRPPLTNYDQIASYNWFGTPTKPIMVVPGAPKVYRHWKGGNLKRETEKVMINENHYMSPAYPMEPLFQAVKICSSRNNLDVKFQQFDLVCDRSVLVKLYSILDGTDEQKQPLRINAYRVGRTVTLVRCHTNDKETLPQNVSIYGRDFVRRSTYKSCSLVSGSHRQIVGYNFGNLKLLVRFEVNCAEDDNYSFHKQKSKWSEMFPNQLTDSTLSVIHWGTRKTYRLMDLTTRLNSRPFPPFVWPQMFFAGGSSLAIGWHFWGQCTVDYYCMEEVEKELASNPEQSLARFHNVVEEILTFIRNQTETKSFAIVWEPFYGKQLKLYEVDDPNTKVLPESLENFVRYN